MSDRNTVSIEDDALVVTPRGLDKIWGFRRRITVLLSAISGVEIEHRPHYVPMGWRGPGLDGFGKLVGTFHPSGERHYWNFSGKGSVLMVDIDGGKPFDRLYLSVADVEDACRMVREASNRR
ncbi:hypothetical protein ACI1US_01115 [Leucobacter sp. BZR 635]